MVVNKEGKVINKKTSAKISIIMGSQSDWPTMKNCVDVIENFDVIYDL